MMIEFLIALLIIKYRFDILECFNGEEYKIEEYGGLDFTPRRRLRLVVNN